MQFLLNYCMCYNDNNLEQNKMKSGQKLQVKQIKLSPTPEQSSQFQQFKDEQFTNHRKSQLHCKRIKQKVINSLSVYTIASMPPSDNSIIPIEIQIDDQQTISNMNKRFNEDEQNPIIGQQKRIRQHRAKTNKQFTSKNEIITVFRYSRNESQKQSPFQLTQQQKELLKSNEKINLIKKILDLYNSKSIERTYYSNLINNLSAKASIDPSAQKNKSVTIKKLPPKNSFRKNYKKVNTTTNENPLKIGQLNMHGFDLAEEYYNHSSITLEAQGMNELIKQFLERKRMNKSAENNASISKKRGKTKSNGELNIIKQGKALRKKLTKYETLSEIKAKMLENMSDNSINHKVNKFRQFLFMINFANGLYRELDIPKYDEPFKVYIGKGNNNNMIKSIMKKRFWFELTKNREEAHFIWTQLKQQSVYERQKQERKQQTSKKLSEAQLATQICEDLKDVEETNHTAREQMADSSTNLQRSMKINSKIRHDTKMLVKNKIKKVQYNSTQMKILTETQNLEYNKILSEFVIRKKYKFSDRIRYMKNIEACSFEQMKSILIHNHLPLNGLLGNKKAMFYMLRQYFRLRNKSIFDIIPLTFHIKKGFLDDQFKAFMQRFQLQSKEGKNYWIIKPGQFSNRGQGITCTDKFEDIRTRISNLRKLGKNKSLILQKYITNPLLYNNRKFDIRTYMLLTVNNGNLRGYWYQDGYIRTSSSIWTLDNIADTFIHLTNDAIQKYSSNYGKYQPGNKLTYSQLQRYLDNLKNGRTYNFQDQIHPLLKEIATNAIKACSVFINPSNSGNNFQIFGFDFMIDTNFKPWLIEINTNPCLQMSCPVLQRIIPSMVQNAFRIAVDPIFVPPMNFSSTYKYNIPQNALHYNKFELIYDEKRDGAELRTLYANNNVVESIDEYEEDKETYEEQGQELALLQP